MYINLEKIPRLLNNVFFKDVCESKESIKCKIIIIVNYMLQVQFLKCVDRTRVNSVLELYRWLGDLVGLIQFVHKTINW